MFGLKKILVALLSDEQVRSSKLEGLLVGLVQHLRQDQQDQRDFMAVQNDAMVKAFRETNALVTQSFERALGEMVRTSATALSEVTRAARSCTGAVIAAKSPDPTTQHLGSVIGMQEQAAETIAKTPFSPSVEMALESEPIEPPGPSETEILGSLLGSPPGAEGATPMPDVEDTDANV